LSIFVQERIQLTDIVTYTSLDKAQYNGQLNKMGIFQVFLSVFLVANCKNMDFLLQLLTNHLAITPLLSPTGIPCHSAYDSGQFLHESGSKAGVLTVAYLGFPAPGNKVKNTTKIPRKTQKNNNPYWKPKDH